MKRNLLQYSEEIPEMDAGRNLSMAMGLGANLGSCHFFAVFERVHESLEVHGSSVDCSRRHSLQIQLSF